MRAGGSGRDRATGAQDEAGLYQAIPQPGASWQPQGHPATQPHEYERGGTAKRLTLLRPATGQIRAKGVVWVTNAVLHPWLTTQQGSVLAEIERKPPAESLPPEEQRAPCARWETWLGHPPRRPLPALRIVLVLDNLAGHLSSDLVQWFFDHGVMPLYTPVGGSWREYWRSRCSASSCAGRSPVSIPKRASRPSTGSSKPWLAGTSIQHPSSGMASADGGANGHAFVAWLAREPH